MTVLGTVRASAQFYTITKESEIKSVVVMDMIVPADNKEETAIEKKGKSQKTHCQSCLRNRFSIV